MELDKIKELRKTAEEHLQESKKSFKKLMTMQESDSQKEENDNTKEKDDQRTGNKRRRVCLVINFIVFIWSLGHYHIA